MQNICRQTSYLQNKMRGKWIQQNEILKMKQLWPKIGQKILIFNNFTKLPEPFSGNTLYLLWIDINFKIYFPELNCLFCDDILSCEVVNKNNPTQHSKASSFPFLLLLSVIWKGKLLQCRYCSIPEFEEKLFLSTFKHRSVYAWLGKPPLRPNPPPPNRT